MTIDRDPTLQALFADARQDLVGDDFTAAVMTKVDRAGRISIIYRIFIVLLFVTGAWFAAAPLQEAAGLVVAGLAQPLIEPEAGVLAWLFSPINTYGGVSALALLGLGTACSRLFLS